MNGTNEQQTLDILGEDELKEAFEAVLFAAGYPLTFEKLSETFGKTDGELEPLPAAPDQEAVVLPKMVSRVKS